MSLDMGLYTFGFFFIANVLGPLCRIFCIPEILSNENFSYDDTFFLKKILYV